MIVIVFLPKCTAFNQKFIESCFININKFIITINSKKTVRAIYKKSEKNIRKIKIPWKIKILCLATKLEVLRSIPESNITSICLQVDSAYKNEYIR